MSELQPYAPSLALRNRTGSQASRSLARLHGNVTLSLASVQAQAELDAAKTDAITAVGAAAMQNVAMLSQMEQSLAQAVPHASGRLAVIADLTALSLGDTVSRAARRIGR